jgi:hypothetical protein
MRKPEYNTAYCVSDASTSNGGDASLPVCTGQGYEQWYTVPSAYDGGRFELCMDNGSHLVRGLDLQWQRLTIVGMVNRPWRAGPVGDQRRNPIH